MAGAGKKTFTAGETLTASDVNTYLMEQSVMVFGGTAARSSAIPTPSEGMTTYRTDTQQIESYDGAEWRGMSGLQLVKKQTIGTGVSSVTVTGAFSATYEAYKIVVIGGTASSSATAFRLSLGSTATGYYSKTFYGLYTDNAVSGFGSGNGTSFQNAGQATSNGLSLNCELQGPFISTRTIFTSSNSAAQTTDAYYQSAGYLNDTTSYTAFTLTPGAGTITGGTIYVYGYGV